MSRDAPKHRYPYRWKDETVILFASEESAEEIMDELNEIQGDEDEE